MKAVILAGGRGTRLKPYTAVFPKPLMPIGEKPILELIIRQLKYHGFNEVILSVGHLAELIMTFFGDGSSIGVKLRYSREDKPLGTAGCLSLIKEYLNEPFLCINGDVLTSINFRHFFNYHKQNGGAATVAINRRDVHIDFGVVDTDVNMNIIQYTEKPTIHYFVSMGLYAFNPDILQFIDYGEYLDFPDLVKLLIKNGESIKAYPHDGLWYDIGRPEDYEWVNSHIHTIYESINL